MENIIIPATVIILTYLLGSIPFGLIIGKLAKGIDIRHEGSKNIGSTNVTRVVGKWWGKLCFFLDFGKGMLPVLAASWLVNHEYVNDVYGILPSVTALVAVLGHVFPVYLRFKGGKGVATAAGAIFALNPLSLLAALALWTILFYTTRYVSLASIFAAVSLPVFCVLFDWISVPGFQRFTRAELVLLCVLAVLAVVKHTSNIKRLLNGTENRFEKKSKNKE